MFCLMFGFALGFLTHWFVTRFKDSLGIFKTNIEKKIDETLKK